MEFVNPSFLYGLFALAIPVIIHLFNFRRFRKLYFTNVAFIRDLKQETRKQSRLKHWLVLFFRMLAIAAVVLAFARPYIPADDVRLRMEDQHSISVYIDNSFSMQAESEGGSLLAGALEEAMEIVSAFKNTDRFNLLTNDFEGRHQRFVSKEEFFDLVNEIEHSPVVKNLREVLVRQTELFRQEASGSKTVFILSDFQKHFMDVIKEPGDSLPQAYLIPMKAAGTNNLTIDSCWFESPVQQINQPGKLFIRLRNLSDVPYSDVPVRLTVNSRQRAVSSFSIGPGEKRVLDLNYTHSDPGIQAGVLEINDHPVTFDDRFFFTYKTMEEANVLGIYQQQPNVYLNTLFGKDTVVRYNSRDMNRLDFSSLRDYDLLILENLPSVSSGLQQELNRFLEAGGSILIFPPSKPEISAYNDFLRQMNTGSVDRLDSTRQRVAMLNAEHPLFTGVFDEIPENMDLPEVFRHYVLIPDRQTGFEPLLSLQNGDPFFGVFPSRSGKIYVSVVPLDPAYSNFPRHPVFVPLIYKIAVSSVAQDNLYNILGKDEVIRTEALKMEQSDEVLKIRDASGAFEVIPGQRRVGFEMELNIYDQIRTAGIYYLTFRDEPIQGMAFNYDRNESEMVFLTPGDIQTLISDQQLTGISLMEPTDQPFSKGLQEMGYGRQLWKLFVLLGLLFLLAETVLLRFLK